MFSEHIEAALRRAKYETLENGTYMATVDGPRGVIAIGKTTVAYTCEFRLHGKKIEINIGKESDNLLGPP